MEYMASVFVSVYSLFMFVIGVSSLVLIWVTIIYLIKKMNRLDQ